MVTHNSKYLFSHKAAGLLGLLISSGSSWAQDQAADVFILGPHKEGSMTQGVTQGVVSETVKGWQGPMNTFLAFTCVLCAQVPLAEESHTQSHKKPATMGK